MYIGKTGLAIICSIFTIFLAYCELYLFSRRTQEKLRHFWNANQIYNITRVQRELSIEEECCVDYRDENVKRILEEHRKEVLFDFAIHLKVPSFSIKIERKDEKKDEKLFFLSLAGFLDKHSSYYDKMKLSYLKLLRTTELYYYEMIEGESDYSRRRMDALKEKILEAAKEDELERGILEALKADGRWYAPEELSEIVFKNRRYVGIDSVNALKKFDIEYVVKISLLAEQGELNIYKSKDEYGGIPYRETANGHHVLLTKDETQKIKNRDYSPVLNYQAIQGEAQKEEKDLRQICFVTYYEEEKLSSCSVMCSASICGAINKLIAKKATEQLEVNEIYRALDIDCKRELANIVCKIRNTAQNGIKNFSDYDFCVYVVK